MWVSIAARLICTRETVHFSGVVCTAPEKLCTHMHPKNTSLIPKETQNLTTKFCIMQLSHEETTPALSSLSSWGWESGKLCGCLLPISTSRTSNTGENKGKETKKTYELSKTLPEAQRTQGIDSLTWVISPAKYNATCIGSKFGQHVMQLELVPSVATRWCYLHYLQNCPPDGAICISCKFGHQMAPLALVPNLATRWRYFHWLQIWPPDGTTCISYKFSYQVESLALVAKLATRWLKCF